jgi:hypothetical protein
MASCVTSQIKSQVRNKFPTKEQPNERIVTGPTSKRNIWCDRMVDCHALPAPRFDFGGEGTVRPRQEKTTCRSA